MRWFTSAKSAAVAIPTVLVYAPVAYACPLCFASSSLVVLRAYLVSTFFMLALGCVVTIAIGLYAARMHSQSVQPKDSTVNARASRSIRSIDDDFDRRIAAAEIVPEEAGGKS
jgi:hypothetical protein